VIKNVLAKVLSGLNDKNIKFNDLRKLILKYKPHKEEKNV